MDEHVRKIRAEIARLRHGQRPTAARYPRVIRSKVTALARRRQARSGDVRTIARDVGVVPRTRALWLRKPSRAIIRALDVVPTTPPESEATGSAPVLITPQADSGREHARPGQGLAAEPSLVDTDPSVAANG
jgi:hypothetical protein